MTQLSNYLQLVLDMKLRDDIQCETNVLKENQKKKKQGKKTTTMKFKEPQKAGVYYNLKTFYPLIKNQTDFWNARFNKHNSVYSSERSRNKVFL